MRIGVDLLYIHRFARIAAHTRYCSLLFTEAELGQADGLGPRRRTERLAGGFSAKEATCKILGRGFGQGVRWRDIEVLRDSWGAPWVTLSGGAHDVAEQAGVDQVAITISHHSNLVIAVAAAGDRTDGGAP